MDINNLYKGTKKGDEFKKLYKEVKEAKDILLNTHNKLKKKTKYAKKINKLYEDTKNAKNKLIESHKKIKHIDNLYKDTKDAKKILLNSHKQLKCEYLKRIKINNTKFKETESNLVTLLTQLKKTDNLNIVFNSYKKILIEFLELKKKMEYFKYLSTPILSNNQLKKMIKEQDSIINHVDKLSNSIPNLTLPHE